MNILCLVTIVSKFCISRISPPRRPSRSGDTGGAPRPSRCHPPSFPSPSPEGAAGGRAGPLGWRRRGLSPPPRLDLARERRAGPPNPSAAGSPPDGGAARAALLGGGGAARRGWLASSAPRGGLTPVEGGVVRRRPAACCCGVRRRGAAGDGDDGGAPAAWCCWGRWRSGYLRLGHGAVGLWSGSG